jgi:hypothetical protein
MGLKLATLHQWISIEPEIQTALIWRLQKTGIAS